MAQSRIKQKKFDFQSLTDAKDHFRHSLGLRKRQAEGRELDEGHQKMIEGLGLCVKQIDQILKRIETEKQINKSSLTLGNKEKKKANTTAQNTYAALMNEDEDDEDEDEDTSNVDENSDIDDDERE